MPRKDLSNAWHGVVKNIKFVQQGARYEVGNDQGTQFWDQK